MLLPGGIRPPRAIFSPDPEYTKEAKDAKFQGTCVLSPVVGTDGNPHDVKVVKSLGEALDEKAIDAIKKWRFEPATKEGVPVATQIEIEVDFGSGDRLESSRSSVLDLGGEWRGSTTPRDISDSTDAVQLC